MVQKIWYIIENLVWMYISIKFIYLAGKVKKLEKQLEERQSKPISGKTLCKHVGCISAIYREGLCITHFRIKGPVDRPSQQIVGKIE